jgi:hypothetical protein
LFALARSPEENFTDGLIDEIWTLLPHGIVGFGDGALKIFEKEKNGNKGIRIIDFMSIPSRDFTSVLFKGKKKKKREK